MAHLSTTFTNNSGFGQAASFVRSAKDQPTDQVHSHENRISQGQYLDQVLNGASPVDIVDHGIGLFEDKTVHFQPSGFGVVCILNVSQHDHTFANLLTHLNLPHAR